METKDRFLKLMALTTSNNDHEALLALRTAQKLLESSNLTWEKLMSPKTVFIEVEKSSPPKAVLEVFEFIYCPKMPKDDELKGIFKDIKKKFSLINGKKFEPKTAQFLKSIHSHWMLKSTLSERQIQSLTRICVEAKWK